VSFNSARAATWKFEPVAVPFINIHESSEAKQIFLRLRGAGADKTGQIDHAYQQWQNGFLKGRERKAHN